MLDSHACLLSLFLTFPSFHFADKMGCHTNEVYFVHGTVHFLIKA